MSTRFEHISPEKLPAEWTRALGLKPGQRVIVTVEAEAPRKSFDRAAIEAALARLKKLPVLDERTPDDILGYDENGLPT